jgi:nucleoside-diphosphate-sugar epimerase
MQAAEQMPFRLVLFGPGYCGRAIAQAAETAGFAVIQVGRDSAPEQVLSSLRTATHVLSTVPPADDGDPVLARYEPALRSAPAVRWIGYLSSTAVYGDRAGAWVDESTPASPSLPRARHRLAAEEAWSRLGQRCAVDIFRLAGIYGPGRSAFDDLRAGRARRVLKPGHAFGRIHRDDIVRAVLAAMAQARAPGARILNLSDDEPAESASVIAEAARLMGVPPPPAIPFEQAVATMSPMARGFWAENRKVCARATKATLGIAWRYPTYREGLRAIWLAERSDEIAPSARAD